MKASAGLLMYRKTAQGHTEVFLGHPGGPFFAKKDLGAWSIPKGIIEAGEEKLTAAQREFTEETGIEVPQNIQFIDLGSVIRKDGRPIYAWAFEWPKNTVLPPLKSNASKFGWPEFDRAQFFSIEVAKEKINPMQLKFLESFLATD